MKSLDRNQFLKPVVETRILEKRLLSRGSFEKMLQMQEFRRIRSLLIGAGYSLLFAEDATEAQVPALLNECMADFLDEILRISPPVATEYLDLLFLEYDIHNIQAALMRRQEGARASNRPISLPRDRAARYAALLDGTAEGDDAYARLLWGAQREYQKSPRAAQQWLDREYFNRLAAVAASSGIPLFMEYIKAKADFYNILLLLRLRRMQASSPGLAGAGALGLYRELLAGGGAIDREFLGDLFPLRPEEMARKLDQTPYRRTLTVGVDLFGYGMETFLLEKDMDDYLSRLVRASRHTAIGPEPLFGYLYGRRMEIINLRLLFAVRLQGLPEQAARERLRETYV